ncbi:hypothetical protein KL86DES1_21628 [uncultured Desulfovibrio sp.]|uniref:Uncharacterized protein n=1 Tax=uncultured Desulfovibrio sp. TaxID=167968 RepID=A0A212L8P1_9BACT|nr:hypothetical protein KL86DES1_21628 [uncultured Desulfovibrio sp.]VZH34533.1 conserved protein of unknown function [Desulfovibrio sp. 86]
MYFSVHDESKKWPFDAANLDKRIIWKQSLAGQHLQTLQDCRHTGVPGISLHFLSLAFPIIIDSRQRDDGAARSGKSPSRLPSWPP